MWTIWLRFRCPGIDCTTWNEFECVPFDIIVVAVELIILRGMDSNVYHLTSFSLPWHWVYYVEWMQMCTIWHHFRCPGIDSTTWNELKLSGVLTYDTIPPRDWRNRERHVDGKWVIVWWKCWHFDTFSIRNESWLLNRWVKCAIIVFLAS